MTQPWRSLVGCLALLLWCAVPAMAQEVPSLAGVAAVVAVPASAPVAAAAPAAATNPVPAPVQAPALATAAEKPVAPAGANPAAAAAAPAAAPAAADAAEAQQEAETIDPATMPSLFFSAVELDSIANAKRQFLEGINEPAESEADLLDQLQGIKAATTEDLEEKTFAQFYLETLIYRSPTDWTVYVRDNDASKKYTPQTEVPEDARLKIIVIKPEEVWFEWHPRNWQYVSSKFEEGRNIKLDTARQMVIFPLRVNQTLSAYDMDILEGPVASTNADGTKKEAAKKAEPKKPAPKKPEAKKPDEPKPAATPPQAQPAVPPGAMPPGATPPGGISSPAGKPPAMMGAQPHK